MSKLTAADPQDERAIAYAVAAQEVFAGLRALIGQLSGTLILAQARLRREVFDFPEIAVARERWRETIEQLARLDAPEDRAGDYARLQEAAAHINGALAGIARVLRDRTDDAVGDAARHLRVAYRLMQRVCDHRIGLTMVDMSEACCTCGKPFGRQAGTPLFERMGA
jgi:hypothetical protein